METKTEKKQSRRKFLKMVASITGSAVIVGASIYKRKKRDRTDEIWRLNPAFRINEISTDTIEIFTHLGDGKRVQHRFSGLEADMFRAIDEEKKLNRTISKVAGRHHLTEAECRTQLNQFIDEFEATRLIYTGEKMLVKIVEATNG